MSHVVVVVACKKVRKEKEVALEGEPGGRRRERRRHITQPGTRKEEDE